LESRLVYSNIIGVQSSSKRLPNTARFCIFIHPFVYSKFTVYKVHFAMMATAAVSNK